MLRNSCYTILEYSKRAIYTNVFQATTEESDRPDDVVDETGSQKSDIDSVDMPINGTLTARLESGAPLPTEIYNVAALRDPTEL